MSAPPPGLNNLWQRPAGRKSPSNHEKILRWWPGTLNPSADAPTTRAYHSSGRAHHLGILNVERIPLERSLGMPPSPSLPWPQHEDEWLHHSFSHLHLQLETTLKPSATHAMLTPRTSIKTSLVYAYRCFSFCLTSCNMDSLRKKKQILSREKAFNSFQTWLPQVWRKCWYQYFYTHESLSVNVCPCKFWFDSRWYAIFIGWCYTLADVIAVYVVADVKPQRQMLKPLFLSKWPMLLPFFLWHE